MIVFSLDSKHLLALRYSIELTDPPHTDAGNEENHKSHQSVHVRLLSGQSYSEP